VTLPEPPVPDDLVVVVPAWNEQESVGLVIKEIQTQLPSVRILVVDDASTDRTAEVAREAGATVITNPFNLGVGGAVRVGFRYAQRSGASALVQVDADGQHDPKDIADLVGVLDQTPAPHVVIGARFSGVGDFDVPRARRVAMRILAAYLSYVTKTHLTDVTSGFRAHNRSAIELFAREYPSEYLADTVESLIINARAHGHVSQTPVAMRPRYAGTPSQSSVWAMTYLLRVMAMLTVNIVRHQPARHPSPAEHPTPAESP
jgi:glycosyltransferase involved in cell wall biosynthesis